MFLFKFFALIPRRTDGRRNSRPIQPHLCYGYSKPLQKMGKKWALQVTEHWMYMIISWSYDLDDPTKPKSKSIWFPPNNAWEVLAIQWLPLMVTLAIQSLCFLTFRIFTADAGFRKLPSGFRNPCIHGNKKRRDGNLVAIYYSSMLFLDTFLLHWIGGFFLVLTTEDYLRNYLLTFISEPQSPMQEQ